MPHASPIITFTGNPLAESTMTFADWAPGRTQRAGAVSFQMGGKGINVAKMLLRFAAPVTALTFLGGATGEQCRAWLKAHGIPFHAFPTHSATRSGLVVRSDGKPETTFLGPDSPPDAKAWQEAARHLSHIVANASNSKPMLALCGSMPGWENPAAEPFRAVLDLWLKSSYPLAVDSYGPPLAWLVNHPVDLVKINAHEFSSLLGTEARATTEENLRFALSRWPVKAWIITDGAKPVWFAEAESAPASIKPPEIKEVSATGSGDVLLACLLHAKQRRKLSLRNALDFAIPHAAANAAHPGIAEYPML